MTAGKLNLLNKEMPMLLRVRLGLTATMLCLLAACGGGGGGGGSGTGNPTTPPTSNTPPPSTPPPPEAAPQPQPQPPAQPAPTAEDLANASRAGLQVTLSVNTNLLEITWNDTFTSESGFRVESRATGGTWQIEIATEAGNQTGFYWQDMIDASRTYRVIALLGGYTVPLQTPGGQTEIPVELAATPIAIQLDQTAPVHGIVQLSLANGDGIQEVSYEVNDTTIGTSTAGPNFPLSWNTGAVQDGPHDVRAVARKISGLSLFVRREVAVGNTAGQTGAELISTNVSYILGTEQGAVLYEKVDGSVIWRNASGVEVTLQIPAGSTQLQAFTLSGGYIAFVAAPPAAPTGTYHVYLADPSGQVTNFSEPLGTTSNSEPILKYPWLVWHADDHYEIHNLETQARTSVARPAEATATGKFGNTFVTTPGAEQLLFWADTPYSGSGSGAPLDIFRYDLASGLTQRITTGGTRYRYLETDNQRIAWRRSDTSSMGRDLIVAPVADPTAYTTLSTSMSVYQLRDGLLAWIEPDGNGTAVLKVNDGTTTTVISSVARSAPFVADGRITFMEIGHTYLWKSDTGRQPLLDTELMSPPQHDDGIGYFISNEQSLYRIVLP
jgi:hypothetical protein